MMSALDLITHVNETVAAAMTQVTDMSASRQMVELLGHGNASKISVSTGSWAWTTNDVVLGVESLTPNACRIRSTAAGSGSKKRAWMSRSLATPATS